MDALPTLASKEIDTIFDASGKSMEVLGGVTIEVELKRGLRDMVTFHIVRKCDEILLGMNAFQRLGVKVTNNDRIREQNTRHDTEAHILEKFQEGTKEVKAIVRTTASGPSCISVKRIDTQTARGKRE